MNLCDDSYIANRNNGWFTDVFALSVVGHLNASETPVTTLDFSSHLW